MDKTIVYTGDGFVNGLHSFGTILKHELGKEYGIKRSKYNNNRWR